MKADISKIPFEHECCAMVEFCSFIDVIGKLNNGSLKFSLENVNVAKRIYSLSKELLKIHPEIVTRKSKKLTEHNIYTISIMLSDYKKMKPSLRKACCKKAYLRGIFLAAGSITNPNNYYHIEMVFKDEILSKRVQAILSDFEIYAKISKRKNNYILYIKESEQISSFLNVIGAHKALLELENIRILKDMRNNVNRMVNCETANLTKIVDASVKHINSINFLKKINQFDKLSPLLKEIAEARINNPDCSLKELGQMLNNPVGKSGVNHRLKKIVEIAEQNGM